MSATHIQGMFGVTLDDLCSEWGFPYPNYIKIDVDGIEISLSKERSLYWRTHVCDLSLSS